MSVEAKLKAVRVAANHQFPTANIDRMLTEIELGYAQFKDHIGALPGSSDPDGSPPTR